MRTLLDIKNALKDVPDSILDNLWFGLGECAEEEVTMLAPVGDGENEFPQFFENVDKKFPGLSEFSKLVKNISKAQVILSDDSPESSELSERLFDDAVTDTFFDKK